MVGDENRRVYPYQPPTGWHRRGARGTRPLEWEKQIKTSAPVGFRRQETKINDIISCRTGRSLPWKRNRVKRSTTRETIDLSRATLRYIGRQWESGIDLVLITGRPGMPIGDCDTRDDISMHIRTQGQRGAE